jgi:hypothetical protein
VSRSSATRAAKLKSVGYDYYPRAPRDLWNTFPAWKRVKFRLKSKFMVLKVFNGGKNPHERAFAKMVDKISKNPSLWKRTAERYREMFDGDLDDFLMTKRLEMLQANNVEVPATVKHQIMTTLENIRGAETGRYPHIAPSKVDVKVSHSVPDGIAGLSWDEIDEVRRLVDNQPKQITCQDVTNETQEQ